APDEDKIIVVPSDEAPIEVTSYSGLPLLYALGIGAERTVSAKIIVDPSSRPACVASNIECRPSFKSYDGKPENKVAEPQPYLRIWYVPPAERREDAELNPGVKERLRALGY